MPPKAKFTREEVIAAALDLVREEGIEGLTARALGKRLGSSVCPLFTVFTNMEEIQAETERAAKGVYDGYVRQGLAEPIPFKGVGEKYILFAEEEPKLFQLLFMTEKDVREEESYLPVVDANYEKILASVRDGYGLSEENSKRLYLHLAIYAHGIACLFARKVCSFSFEEVSRMLTDVCKGLIMKIKGESK